MTRFRFSLSWSMIMIGRIRRPETSPVTITVFSYRLTEYGSSSIAGFWKITRRSMLFSPMFPSGRNRSLKTKTAAESASAVISIGKKILARAMPEARSAMISRSPARRPTAMRAPTSVPNGSA